MLLVDKKDKDKDKTVFNTVLFEKLRNVICPVLKFSKKKRILIKVERVKVCIFLFSSRLVFLAVALFHANVITRIVLNSLLPTRFPNNASLSRSTPTRSAASAAAFMADAPEERLDVLNAAGEKTGVSKPRHAPVPS